MCNLYKFLVLELLKVFEHGSADDRVRFHDLKFFGREPAGLVKYLVVNAYLADIMQRGSHGDKREISVADIVFRCFPDKAVKKHFGKLPDM